MDPNKLNKSRNLAISMFINGLLIFLVLSDEYSMGMAIIPLIVAVILIILAIIFSTVLFIEWIKKSN
jgi:hypothetical protein